MATLAGMRQLTTPVPDGDPVSDILMLALAAASFAPFARYLLACERG